MGDGPTHEPVTRRVALGSGVELATRDWMPAGTDAAAEPAATFVLTHGLASNQRLWDGVARRLAAAGYRAITVDQRGHGQSSRPDGPYDVVTCADDLALLIGAMELDRPVVAGQSWGGNVVLELAARHPELVAGVVCVDGGAIDLQSRFADWAECARVLAPPRLVGASLEAITGWIESAHADWPAEGRAATLANFEVRPDGTVAPWLSYERHLVVLRGLWEHRPPTRYRDVHVPVLFIGAASSPLAAEDEWTQAKRAAIADAVATLPHGRAEWIAPAHHDVHAEQPDAVTALLIAAIELDFSGNMDGSPVDPSPVDPSPVSGDHL